MVGAASRGPRPHDYYRPAPSHNHDTDNHEEKLLRWYGAKKAGLVPDALGAVHRRVARSLRKEDWETLAATPLWLDLPDHDGMFSMVEAVLEA